MGPCISSWASQGCPVPGGVEPLPPLWAESGKDSALYQKETRFVSFPVRVPELTLFLKWTAWACSPVSEPALPLVPIAEVLPCWDAQPPCRWLPIYHDRDSAPGRSVLSWRRTLPEDEGHSEQRGRWLGRTVGHPVAALRLAPQRVVKLTSGLLVSFPPSVCLCNAIESVRRSW